MNVRLQGICKRFGRNTVLQDVDFSLAAGEICALLGGNGAGKSTLMNILGGILRPNSGQILLNGKPVHFANADQSQQAGIAFIHQELNLINDLTVYENIFLNRMPHSLGVLDTRRMRQETEKLMARLQLDISPDTQVGSLDASYKQFIEISRAFMQNASVLIMDEPTTALTEPEVQRVFTMMRTLKEQGVSIIFISHKLDEVMEICDCYSVLRDGRVVASGEIADTTAEQLVTAMVGHAVNSTAVTGERDTGPERLRIEHLSDRSSFQDISLSVASGEILGITGLMGDGRSELFQTVFGLRWGEIVSGHVFLDGAEIHPRDAYRAIRLGVAYLPRNRLENAILKDMSILDNGTLVRMPMLARRHILRKRYQLEALRHQYDHLKIKMDDEDDPITVLSGGNQQRVVLIRWLMMEPKVMILDNPTQGVDVSTKEDIYRIIANLAREGIAVVILSSEAQEILRLCDRCLVMDHGRLAGELAGAAMNEHDIMLLATGGQEADKQ